MKVNLDYFGSGSSSFPLFYSFGEKNPQLSRLKTRTYRTIRVSWSGSEEVFIYLLKSYVRPPELLYLRRF